MDIAGRRRITSPWVGIKSFELITNLSIEFISSDDLISDIHEDIADSRVKLDEATLKALKDDDFLSKPLSECQRTTPTVDADR